MFLRPRGRRFLFLVAVLAPTGCATADGVPPLRSASIAPVAPPPVSDGTSGSHRRQPSSDGSTAPVEAREAPPAGPPDRCAAESPEICTPAIELSRRLCSAGNPEVALAMFAKGTPWTRGYVRRDMEAWYVGGRARPVDLRLAEEVLIVAIRRPQSGVQVGAGGSYDALRWDGSCVSLMADEVSLRRPSVVEHARIRWQSLGPSFRDALRAREEKLDKLGAEWHRACAAGASGADCARADARISGGIVEYVRGGGAVPAPEQAP